MAKFQKGDVVTPKPGQSTSTYFEDKYYRLQIREIVEKLDGRLYKVKRLYDGERDWFYMDEIDMNYEFDLKATLDVIKNKA